MALINTQIQPSKFEAIRDRIALILAMELENQFVTFGDYELDLDVWTERGEKIDNSECPAIIVSLASGDFSSQHQGSYLGEYTYNVDIYSSKMSEYEDYGSTLSTIALHKIAGVCTKIIEDPQYKTLGFQAPSISHREVSSMIIAPPDPNDAAYVAVGRLVVKVNVVEGTDLLTALNFEGADTSVKLYNTTKGLLYSGSGYAPPLPSNQVQLLVNGDEFDIIDGGETFDLPVVDQDGNEVGQQIGNEFVVTITTCQDIKDCLGIDTINGEVDEFLNKRGQWIEISGGGAVDSVNGKTGVVVLDADDIAETATRFWLTNILKSAYDSAVTWISTNGTNLLNHLTNTSNPHSTTAAQVGAPSGSGTSTGTNTGDQDLSGLVPYTGATSDVNLGNNYITAKNAKIAGTGGNGFIELLPQNAGVATPASGVRLWVDNAGRLGWRSASGYAISFDDTGLNGSRNYVLPNASGTLALTSDLDLKQDNLLISSATASNSAVIDFTLPTGYAYFELFIEHLIPQTNATSMFLRVSVDGGATFLAGASDYEMHSNILTGSYGTTYVPSYSLAAQIAPIGALIGNTAGRFFRASFRIFDPSNATQNKNFTGEFAMMRSDGQPAFSNLSARVFNTSPVNAIRLLMNSGNIASGVFKLYGYKS